LEAELAHLTDPVSRLLHTLVQQTGHLLTPMAAPNGLAATLACRLRDDPDLAAIAGPLESHLPGRYLQHRGPLPDRPHPPPPRLSPAPPDPAPAPATPPPGHRPPPPPKDRPVRIWNAPPGECRPPLTGHTDGVTSLAIAPDGTWLATAASTGHKGKDR